MVRHQAIAHILAYLQLNGLILGEGLAILLLLRIRDAALLGWVEIGGLGLFQGRTCATCRHQRRVTIVLLELR